MIIISITINNVSIKNPYAVILLPEYNIVRIGEKELMEEYYKEIIDKINNYDGVPAKELYSVLSILKQYGFSCKEPTIEEVKSLLDDYILMELPKDENEVKKMIEHTGYLKSLMNKSNMNGVL